MASSLPVRRRSRWLRRTLLVLGVVVVLCATALVAGEHHLEGPLTRFISAHASRKIQVDGAFEAHLLSLHPTITANQVSIGNPPWMPAGVAANVGRLSLILEWRPAVLPLAIRRLQIEHATLHLRRDSSGRSNWSMHEAGPGKGPPLIRSLSMLNARVELDDDRRHVQFSGIVSAGDASGGAEMPPLRIEGAGQLNGRTASFAIDGDPLSQVRRDRPYHFHLEERSGATQLVGSGSITQPFDFRVLQGTFAASGPDMKDLYFLVGLGLPDTGPYRLSGRLARQGKRFVYSELTATSGKSDMSGTLSVDSSSGRARIDGELNSESLRLADIGARAARLVPQPSQLSALRVPDTPFHLNGMRRADAAIRFRARALALGSEQLRSVSAGVAINRGVLAITGFSASLAQATLSGSARLDASRQLPRGELKLSVAGLPLEHFKGRSGDPPFTGVLSGRVQLSGEGKSFHALAATADGTMTAVVPHGSVRASIADVASLDLIGALGAQLKSQAETDLRCAVASFDVHDGVVTAHTFVIDTEKVLITGTGDAHMDSEKLDFTLRGRPKNVRLALRSAVAIRGTLRHPEMRLGGHDVLAATLKVVLKPVAAVLQSVDPALPRDADCAGLIAQAKSAASTGGANDVTAPASVPNPRFPSHTP